jgi:hypothetical protein
MLPSHDRRTLFALRLAEGPVHRRAHTWVAVLVALNTPRGGDGRDQFQTVAADVTTVELRCSAGDSARGAWIAYLDL